MDKITEYENTLRFIILKLLGVNEDTYKIPLTQIDKWKEKQKAEQEKNKGVRTESRIIYYSEFYHLKDIISKNWNKFQLLFHDKERFETFFDEMQKYRNTLAHGRNINKAQELLLEGILLDTKNLKTIFFNKMNNRDAYFIQITKISDNLGNIWLPESLDSWLIKPTLRVGDEYEISIEAHDPKDEEMEYEIYLGNNFVKKQKENRFNFLITENMVGPHVFLSIFVRTPNSKYTNQSVAPLISVIILPKDDALE